MKCRFCDNTLKKIFADLGETPLANSYLTKETIKEYEKKFPLRALVCEECFLVQVDEFEKPQNIFNDYAYFSSYSTSWLEHVKEFSNEIIKKFSLDSNNQIIEIASNDGYLLKNFKEKNIPVLGIEPASNVAKVAEKNGIRTVNRFFGTKTATELRNEGISADVLIAFNVLPHVPNLKDFVLGMKQIIKENGIIIIQFSAYLIDLIEKNEFDMIYHEHFSYFSLHSLKKIFQANDLEIFDVKRIPVHGGSLRIFLKLKNNKKNIVKSEIKKMLEYEEEYGLNKINRYDDYQEKIVKTKQNILDFLKNTKLEKKKIVGYGAAAKANTLLNYCEINKNDIEYIVDINPHKQGKFMPGSHIPIFSPEKMKETKPDLVVIFAYNLKDEIILYANFIKKWGGRFVILIPEVKIID